jgi:hypothetical protein
MKPSTKSTLILIETLNHKPLKVEKLFLSPQLGLTFLFLHRYLSLAQHYHLQEATTMEVAAIPLV